MTNESRGNRIQVFLRDRKGRLAAVPHGMVPTGGLGGSANAAIDPLGSQGSLMYDRESQMLFAVNAGDNTVTAFDTGALGWPLQRRARVSSGGYIPVSLAVSENRLYVLNAGGTGAVTTFEIGEHGELMQLGSLNLGLQTSATSIPFAQVPAPGQVGVDALSRHLIITHAGGQEVLTVQLNDQGLPAGPLVSTLSPGAGPFSFAVTHYGTTIVAEAAASAWLSPDGSRPKARGWSWRNARPASRSAASTSCRAWAHPPSGSRPATSARRTR